MIDLCLYRSIENDISRDIQLLKMYKGIIEAAKGVTSKEHIRNNVNVIKARIDCLISQRQQILDGVEKIEYEQYRSVLRLLYIIPELATYRDIADEMGCTVEEVRNLRDKALLEYERVTSNDQ